MNPKRYFFVGVVVLILTGVTSYFWWQFQVGQWTAFISDNPKLTFLYPKGFKQGPLPEDVQNNLRFIFQASQGQIQQPLSVDLRVETKLRIAVTLTRQEMIPMLLGNFEQTALQRFPDFKKESERNFELDDKKSAELYFTYTGPAGERIKQRLLIIAYDGDTALYFAAQAKTSDFDQLNNRYFNRLFENLKFD